MSKQGLYIQSVPAHKQTDPAKAPGQIVNPIPESKLYKPSHGGYQGTVNGRMSRHGDYAGNR